MSKIAISVSECAMICALALSAPAQAQITRCMNGEGPYHGPFERGLCAVQYCGNDPESWTRGVADLNTSTGRFGMTIQLETDSVNAGPKGTIVSHLKDGSGHELGSATLSAALGGKHPGYSRIESTSKVVMISPDAAKKVKSVTVDATCTGKQSGLLGTPISTIGFSKAIGF